MITDYSMSDALFRLRAGEEDGCMIGAVGAGLAREMNSAPRVSVALNEEQRRYVQGKLQAGQFRSVSDLFEEALRVLESHDSLKTLQLKELRARINESMPAVEAVDSVDGREFVENLISRLQEGEVCQKGV